jgi:hypothetical protein
VVPLFYKLETRCSTAILSAHRATDRSRDPAIWLEGFQAELSFTLGAGFADPDHLAALGGGHIFSEDKFDHLAAPKIETSSEPETFFRRIDDEAGESLRVAVQIDDQTGGSLRYGPP